MLLREHKDAAADVDALTPDDGQTASDAPVDLDTSTDTGALDTVERDASLTAELYLLKGEILAELGQEEAARAAFDRADELMR